MAEQYPGGIEPAGLEEERKANSRSTRLITIYLSPRISIDIRSKIAAAIIRCARSWRSTAEAAQNSDPLVQSSSVWLSLRRQLLSSEEGKEIRGVDFRVV